MIIKELHISNLRNHTSTSIELGKTINVIYGLNGSGKTTLLEAVSIASLTKTFLPTSDAAMIRTGEPSYKISAYCSSDVDVDYKINVEYKSGGRKKFNTSVGDNLTPKEVIGIIPLVILSPDYKSLTFGSPLDKRHFLDVVLSQSGRQYVDESLKYKKYLKQRNSMLTQYVRTGTINRDYFEILTEMFIKSAIEIIFRRINFIKEFQDFFVKSYLFVCNNDEIPNIEYKPDTFANDNFLTKGDIEILFKKRYQNIFNTELRRGSTLFGPHRDDLTFTINNLNSKDSASQGQHKSLLISIKLAEYEFLKSILNETPVIIFDDIFSELDAKRSALVFDKIVSNQSQTLITMTNAERFSSQYNLTATFFEIENGIVRSRNAV